MAGNTPAQVVQHIMAIAPSETIQNSIVPSLANTQLLSAISELNCPICLSVLRWPIQLPCERLVCARCLTEWIHLRGSFCPCCYDTSPLECTQLKPASRMVQLLLNDVMVSCASCKRNVRAADYDTHTLALMRSTERKCSLCIPLCTECWMLQRRTAFTFQLEEQ